MPDIEDISVKAECDKNQVLDEYSTDRKRNTLLLKSSLCKIMSNCCKCVV